MMTAGEPVKLPPSEAQYQVPLPGPDCQVVLRSSTCFLGRKPPLPHWE